MEAKSFNRSDRSQIQKNTRYRIISTYNREYPSMKLSNWDALIHANRDLLAFLAFRFYAGYTGAPYHADVLTFIPKGNANPSR